MMGQSQNKITKLEKDENGRTPLFHAAADGNLSEVKRLLEIPIYRENIDEKSTPIGKETGGATAFFMACQNNNPEVVIYILNQVKIWDKKGLKHNFDINRKCSEAGDTPFQIAAAEGNIEIIKILFESGNINIEGASDRNSSALMLAIINEFPDTAKFLIEKGAKIRPNSVDDPSNPLHAAAAKGLSQVVTLILNQNPNIDLNVKSLSGKTALELAIEGRKQAKNQNKINEYDDIINVLNTLSTKLTS